MTTAVPRLSRIPREQAGITIGDYLVPIRVGEPLSARAQHLVLVIAGTLFIYLSGRMGVPVDGGPVPLTGLTFGVLLVCGALGFRRGVAAVGLYLLMGLVGLPLFAGVPAGPQLFLGPGGGYLVGLLVGGPLVGRLAELGWDRRFGAAVVAMAIGKVAVYLVALPWLAVVAGLDRGATIELGLVPYAPFALLKIAAAAMLFPAAWWVVGRRPEER